VSALIRALERQEFSLAYQPQTNSNGSSVAGVEALVRWTDPERGAVAPADFVQAAEKSGDIDQLGEWALRRACRDATRWPDLFVAVNVSPRQFRGPDFVDLVRDAASSAGLPLERLELEITEGAYFDEPDRAEAELQALRAIGVSIALDDFGTGYSSLSYLRRLPLNKIKIDKSFVSDIHVPHSASIVTAVISLAHALDLKVTAEGVETQAQLEFLRAAKCDYIQGFLFSGPVEPQQISRLLAGDARPIGSQDCRRTD